MNWNSLGAAAACLSAAAGALVPHSAAHAQHCEEGKTTCGELEVSNASLGRFSMATQQADPCEWLYDYQITLDTKKTSRKVGARYIPVTGPGGVTQRVGDKSTNTCELFARVSFYSHRAPASAAAIFDAEVDGTTGARGDLKICVPKDECGDKKDKHAEGEMMIGPIGVGPQITFESRFDSGLGRVHYSVFNAGTAVATFDWVGLRAMGVLDFRGVLAPGERADTWVQATITREDLAALDVEFEHFGGLIGAVATVVPGRAPCYADCDGNGRLDIRDFFCFQRKYAEGCP